MWAMPAVGDQRSYQGLTHMHALMHISEVPGCPGNRVNLCMVSGQSRNWSTMETCNCVNKSVCMNVSYVIYLSTIALDFIFLIKYDYIKGINVGLARAKP